MYTHENFAADVARNFEFLESEYGMRREPLHIAGAGSWVSGGGRADYESQAFHMNGSGGLVVPWSFEERARSTKAGDITAVSKP